VGGGLDLSEILGGNVTVGHDIVVPEFGQLRDQVFQMAVAAALDAQAARVKAIAKAEGVELIRIFGDGGQPALDMSRHGLEEVLAAAERRIGAVIVEDLARLARDPDDLRDILESLAVGGAIVLHSLG
jgi:DNA invertase Pin-like site-specific DNA recombinase